MAGGRACKIRVDTVAPAAVPRPEAPPAPAIEMLSSARTGLLMYSSGVCSVTGTPRAFSRSTM